MFFLKLNLRLSVLSESGTVQREEEEEDEEVGCNACRGGLTLYPLLALALLFVLLLEFGYQARVHVPGLGDGALLVLVYTEQQTDASGQRQHGTVPGRISQQLPLSGLFRLVFKCSRGAKDASMFYT